jgi:hypothetical protein
MEGLRQSFKNLQDNRVGASLSRPTTIRYSIWTGPLLTNDTTIVQSQGYDKVEHTVYGCSKSAYRLFIRGKYQLDPAILERLKDKIGNQGQFEALIEKQQRSTQQDYTTSAGRDGLQQSNYEQIIEEIEGREVVGRTDFGKHTPSMLIYQLAFAQKEVYKMGVHWSQARGHSFHATHGIVDPLLYEIELEVNSNGVPDHKSVFIVPTNVMPDVSANRVPVGGGVPISDIDKHRISSTIDRPNIGISSKDMGKNIGATIKRGSNIYNSFYNGDSLYGSPETIDDGDLWYGGIRTSMARGIYEVWVDDLGIGPIIRRSRQAVKESSARYYKDIDPTEQRFGNHRVNPLASTFASTSVTPVKTYVYDWFDDVQFYAGLVLGLFAFLRGADEDDIDYNYQEKFVDYGVFDYQKFFRPIEGTEIG